MSEESKPFLKMLSGKPTHEVPFWFMRQAGRYLPEYRELRASRNGFLDMAYHPDSAIEITMQPIRRFGMDAAIIFSDILVVPNALGQALDFVAGEGPKLDPITDISELSTDHFHQTLEPVYDAISGTRQKLREEGFDQTTLIGFAGAPWTVACYMIQGHGGCDFPLAQHMLREESDRFGSIIDVLIDTTAQYLIRQIEAGAEAVQIFDSWSGLLKAEEFKQWSIEPAQKIVQKIRDVHPAIPIIGFPRLAGKENYRSYAQKTGVTAVGLDQSIDTKWAADELQTILPVQGNLDPDILKSGEGLVDAATQILDDLSGGPFVFNLGHGIDKDTPIAHVELLVKTIREYKR